ncbi:hypothetical protein FF011L_28930 [Roseimaritima multifibrata]|uniref:Uncharacterized protein n=1 Tax=Roseimaritima multifibrata TaxID=1930274 RepID=A0A517MGW3_9BACT|nr:hypothetical protein [Roseimaritima multifibrata]QDS94115.1 hypothetical protein FF011L_28930 [Roseimaritima multifibrata]
MSTRLDPTIADKLAQFKRRRQRLILARGICAGIAALLACMFVVALLDWYWLLDDRLRWGLSGAAYSIALMTFWIVSLRKVITAPAIEDVATQIESAEPVLRENLLSAVELANDDPDAIHDSPLFRQLLQGKVAQQIQNVEMTALLPYKLVAKWIAATAAMIGILLLLLIGGGGRFRQLATRAILPGANIARVSRIHVEILEPNPPSLVVAEDETVAIAVRISGGKVREVLLETFSDSEGTTQQPMAMRDESQFVANLHVVEGAIEYRILAGDAVTERYRIESIPRPRVESFEKEYAYPEYSQLPNKVVKEANGDLIALQGTKAHLTIDVDQTVTQAELRLDLADEEETKVIPLKLVDSNTEQGRRWETDLAVETAGIYRVHLFSEHSQLENRFSPRYEIQPQPDTIPRVGFIDQNEGTLLLPPNDILALEGIAEDDLPLNDLQQQISVNGEEWLSVPLKATAVDGTKGQQINAQWKWDLVRHNLKTGDQVMTQLVATDRKGNQGKSVPLRILVAAPDFDPERHSVMKTKTSLLPSLDRFAQLLAEQFVTAKEILEGLSESENVSDLSLQDREILIDLAAKQKEQARLLFAETKAIEKQMPAGADAYDLDLTGRVIARIQQEHSSTPAYLIQAMETGEDVEQFRKDVTELQKAFEKTASDAENTAKHYRALAAHNVMIAIASDLDALLLQQKLIVDSPTQTWERLLRQETIVVNQLQALETLVRDHRTNVPDYLSSTLNNLIRWSETQRDRIQLVSESEDQLPQLQEASKYLLGQLTDTQRMNDQRLTSLLTTARRDLSNRAGSLYSPIYELARSTEQENRLVFKASQSPDSQESASLISEAERYSAATELKHAFSIDQLTSRRELTQARSDADLQYAADAGLTQRAVDSLLGLHQQASQTESTIPANLLEVAPAYRILEAGHQLVAVKDALETLLNQERWGSQNLKAAFDHPRQWGVILQGLELTSRRMREAQIDSERSRTIDQLRWSESVRNTTRKIMDRNHERDAMVSAAHELVVVRDTVKTVLEELQPQMAEARAIIAKFSPTISQMAQQAADQLRLLEEKSTELADAVEAPDPTETDQPLEQIKEQQSQINQQIADLFEALIEEANSQDLLDADQRERARDADDSIAMIKEPAVQMNRSLEEAVANAPPETLAKELSEAAEDQEKTAQALEQVANHFERLETGDDIAESRAALRESEREMQLASNIEQQYNKAEQIDRLTSKSAAQLLADLEQELATNPAMQQALSELSQKTLEESKNALELATEDEHRLQLENERSDLAFNAQKKAIAQEIQKLAKSASTLSESLVAQAEQSASIGKSETASESIEQARATLADLAEKAAKASDQMLLEDMAQTANETQASLRQANEMLGRAKKETNQAKNEEVHETEEERAKQQKDSEQRDDRFRQQQKRIANDLVKRAEQQKRVTTQNLKNATSSFKKTQQSVEKAQADLAKKPKDSSRQSNLDRQKSRAETEQLKVEIATKADKLAAEDVAEAKDNLDQINRKSKPKLDAKNPATQLADNYLEDALKVAADLNRSADEIEKAIGIEDQLTPTKDQLVNAERQQESITTDVQQAAENVQRVARHERRLEKGTVSKALQAVAEGISKVAKEETNTASDRLNEAAEAAGASEAGESQAADSTRSRKAQDALKAAESALANQANGLNDVLEPLAAAAEAAQATAAQSAEGSAAQPAEGSAAQPSEASANKQNGEGGPAAFSPEEMARAERLARTLDDLDQQSANATSAELAAQTVGQLDSLTAIANSQRSEQVQARQQIQQQVAEAMGTESSQTPGATGTTSEFKVLALDRSDDKAWGKLRDQSAKDLAKGETTEVSEEYRKSVDTYFKVLAERGRQK